jgi:RND family efflux transporter MFP subunit
MKKAIVIIIVIAVLALIIYKISTYQKGQTAQSISDIQREKGVPVEVQTVRQDTLVYSLQFSGNVEGYSEARAISHLTEKVSEVRVKVGDRVVKGDVLVELSKTNPQAQYQQAKLAYDNAKREYERVSALYEQGAVSRQTYDQTALAKDMAQTNLSNATELVEVTAPIDGVVTDILYKHGEVVSSNTPVVVVSSIDRIKCDLLAGDADRQQIKLGQIAQFSRSTTESSANTEYALQGTVTQVALSADNETHLFKIVAAADNRNNVLIPGQLVSVKIITQTFPNVLLIPQDAIIMQNDKPFVFNVENDIANLIPITLGRENMNTAEVVKGLSAGDTIVVYGMNRLKSGEKVKIVTSTGEVANVSE